MILLLSICIPTYNRCEMVFDTVQQCLKIPGDFYEVLVVDDGSTDDTSEILMGIQDKKLRYIKNDVNLGYSNMGYALKEGKGDYCLLLGDKDELVDVDWESFVSLLRSNDSVSIFHWEYYDSDGHVIRKVRSESRRKLSKGSFESMLFGKYHFAEAAGFVFRRTDIDLVWDAIDKTTLIWNTYPQEVISLHLAAIGDVCFIEIMKTRLKDEKRKIHIYQTFSGQKEPYWCPESRTIQNKEWISEIAGLGISEQIKRHLMHTVCVNAIKQIGVYNTIIYDEDKMNSEFYSVIRNKAKEDRTLDVSDWNMIIIKVIKVLLSEIRHSNNWKHRFITLDLEYTIRRFIAKRKVLKTISSLSEKKVM